MPARSVVDNRPVAGSGEPPDGDLRRPLAVALVVLGVVTFVVALLSLVLTAHAHDFCDSTCSPGGASAGLSAIAMVASLVQIGAAANRSRSVALGAFGVSALALWIPILLVIVLS